MRLEEINSEWSKDSVIEPERLDEASRESSRLHGKYSKILTEERMIMRKLEMDRDRLRLAKWEHLTGVMSEEELKARGWEPERRRILRSDVDMYVAADREVIDLNLRIALQQEKVKLLESIIHSINSRTFLIGNAIKWLLFKHGIG